MAHTAARPPPYPMAAPSAICHTNAGTSLNGEACGSAISVMSDDRQKNRHGVVAARLQFEQRPQLSL